MLVLSCQVDSQVGVHWHLRKDCLKTTGLGRSYLSSLDLHSQRPPARWERVPWHCQGQVEVQTLLCGLHRGKGEIWLLEWKVQLPTQISLLPPLQGFWDCSLGFLFRTFWHWGREGERYAQFFLWYLAGVEWLLSKSSLFGLTALSLILG